MRDDKPQVTHNPVKCLAEIVELTIRRMETGATEMGELEALTLGQITGIALRVPGVGEMVGIVVDKK